MNDNELKKAADKAFYEWEEKQEWFIDPDYEQFIEAFVIGYQKAQEEKQGSEWVSVSDRLPEIGTEVNVLTIKKTVTSLARFISHSSSVTFYWDNFYGGSNMCLPEHVTHWQLLPSRPPS